MRDETSAPAKKTRTHGEAEEGEHGGGGGGGRQETQRAQQAQWGAKRRGVRAPGIPPLGQLFPQTSF